jgi:hypothetical protein
LQDKKYAFFSPKREELQRKKECRIRKKESKIRDGMRRRREE